MKQYHPFLYLGNYIIPHSEGLFYKLSLARHHIVAEAVTVICFDDVVFDLFVSAFQVNAFGREGGVDLNTIVRLQDLLLGKCE
jgi:hypothetical protein